jgi:hypothetical protein
VRRRDGLRLGRRCCGRARGSLGHGCVVPLTRNHPPADLDRLAGLISRRSRTRKTAARVAAALKVM